MNASSRHTEEAALSIRMVVSFKNGQIVRFQQFFDTYAAGEAFVRPEDQARITENRRFINSVEAT